MLFCDMVEFIKLVLATEAINLESRVLDMIASKQNCFEFYSLPDKPCLYCHPGI